MADELPTRYNHWGHWQPLLGRGPQSRFLEIMREMHGLQPPALKAAFQYCAYSGHLGIEFVVLSNFEDSQPLRIPQGPTIALCPDHASTGEGMLAPPWHIYDGWLPVASSAPQALAAGLETIDQFVTALGFIHRCRTRWLPKYLETVTPNARRSIGTEDRAQLGQFLQRSTALPEELRDAVFRCMHWYQHAQQTLSQVERFLSLFYALEGLFLALFDDGPSIGLPLAGLRAREERRKLRADAARTILNRRMDNDPVAAVQEAYFTALVPIRRRIEEVARAVSSPESDFATWLCADRGGDDGSPSRMRSGLVHGALRAADVTVQSRLVEYSERLDNAIRATILRVALADWSQGPPEPRQQSFTLHMPAGNTAFWTSTGGPEFSGDTRITLGLLASKGLI